MRTFSHNWKQLPDTDPIRVKYATLADVDKRRYQDESIAYSKRPEVEAELSKQPSYKRPKFVGVQKRALSGYDYCAYFY